MDELQVFTHPDFGSLEVWIGPDGKPWFPARESAQALGYSNDRDAISKHCDAKGVAFRDALTAGGIQQKKYINRPNLSRLITRSNLPRAARFESWIFDEVLESVFDHGAYMTPEKIEEALLNPDTIITLALKLKEEQRRRGALEAQAAINAPKAEFYDAVTGSRTAIPFDRAAKVLGFHNMGRNNLFAFLRDQDVLMADNLPYQAYIDRGYFRVVESKYKKPNGDVEISLKTLIHQKGLDYIRKLLEKAGYKKSGLYLAQ